MWIILKCVGNTHLSLCFRDWKQGMKSESGMQCTGHNIVKHGVVSLISELEKAVVYKSYIQPYKLEESILN